LRPTAHGYFDVVSFSISVGEFHWRYFDEDFWQWYGFVRNHTMRWSLLAPALLIHLWLPLFALGILIAQFLNSIRASGHLSQWFFARGEAHPQPVNRLHCGNDDVLSQCFSVTPDLHLLKHLFHVVNTKLRADSEIHEAHEAGVGRGMDGAHVFHKLLSHLHG
jgi:hypothetical protein